MKSMKFQQNMNGIRKKIPNEYEYEYYSVWKNHPNTNTNIIRFEKITWIRIRILEVGLNYSNNFRIPNYLLTSVTHGVHHDIIHGVPHTNIIRFEKIDRIRIRILFGLEKLPEYKYEYYSAWKKSTEYEYKYYLAWKNHPNTDTNTSIGPQLFK